jgi:hypothetical protein
VENTGDADHWEVKLDSSLYDDGKDGVITFDDGRETVYTKNKGKQGSLEEYLGLDAGTGYKLLMGPAGFAYDAETRTWTGSGKTISAEAIKDLIKQGIITAPIIAEPAEETGSAVPDALPETKLSFTQQVKAAASAVWNGIKTAASAVGNFFGNLFKKQTTVPVKEAAPEKPYEQPSDYFMVTKEQWDKLADPEFYSKYEAQVKTKTGDPLDQLNGLSTQCNTFVDTVIKVFGDQVYKDIMPNGSQSPNALYETWNANQNLLQLKNGDDAWAKAQEYADQGYIVLSAASEKGNHVAFVLPKGYEYNSLPSTDWKQREGVTVPQGNINYSGTIKTDWPAFLQAGSYTGIVSPHWAYSSNMANKNEVYFYVYKGGKNETYNFYHFRSGRPVFGMHGRRAYRCGCG